MCPHDINSINPGMPVSDFRKIQAQKGFPPPTMKGMGYFQNLRIFFGNVLDISGNFLGGFFVRTFCEDFSGVIL